MSNRAEIAEIKFKVLKCEDEVFTVNCEENFIISVDVDPICLQKKYGFSTTDLEIFSDSKDANDDFEEATCSACGPDPENPTNLLCGPDHPSFYPNDQLVGPVAQDATKIYFKAGECGSEASSVSDDTEYVSFNAGIGVSVNGSISDGINFGNAFVSPFECRYSKLINAVSFESVGVIADNDIVEQDEM